MEKIALDLINNGLQLTLVWTLVQLMITFFVIIFLKSVVSEYFAYRKVRSNKRIALGAWLRIDETDCKIIAIDPSRVLLEGKDVIVDLPIKRFLLMQKWILKKSPDIGIIESES